MKLKFLLPACAAFAVISLGSCKKDSTATDSSDVETTFALSADQGISENLTQDATDVVNEAGIDYGFAGSHFVGGNTGTTHLNCAVVTVTPQTGFPKDVTIDFGTPGCVSQNGVYRSGVMHVHITDSLHSPNSVATITFDNYYVGVYKKEGVITWTNTSTATTTSWHRNCTNGKITAPNGDYWLHEGDQDIVQTAGTSTPTDNSDDVYSITGGHTVTNSAGRSRTCTILTALEKKGNCSNIDMGTYKIQATNHYAIIDFGDGTCDNQATISINGNTPRTFTLR